MIVIRFVLRLRLIRLVPRLSLVTRVEAQAIVIRFVLRLSLIRLVPRLKPRNANIEAQPQLNNALKKDFI